MYQIKPKRQIIFVTVFFTLLVGGLCCTLLLLFWQWWKDSLSLSTFMGWRVANWECYKVFTQTLANLCFSGIRLEFDSAFPPKLDWNNWSIISRPRFLPESSGNFKFSDLFLRATTYRKVIHRYESFFFFAIISGPQFVEIHLILLPWQCDIMTYFISTEIYPHRRQWWKNRSVFSCSQSATRTMKFH